MPLEWGGHLFQERRGCYFTQILTCLCSKRHIIPSLSPFWSMCHKYHSFALTLLIYQLFFSTSIRVFYFLFFWVKATWDKGLSTLAFPILLFVRIHALECERGSKHSRCLKIVSKCCSLGSVLVKCQWRFELLHIHDKHLK
jgi:hypothetical protein